MNLWKKSHKKSHLVEKSQKSDELLQKRHKLMTKIPRTCPTSDKLVRKISKTCAKKSQM